MKRGGLNPNLKLKLSLPPPDEVSIAKFLYVCYLISPVFLDFIAFVLADFLCLIPRRTQSGTFMDGDLLVNRDGVRIVSQDSTEAVRFSVSPFSF